LLSYIEVFWVFAVIAVLLISGIVAAAVGPRAVQCPSDWRGSSRLVDRHSMNAPAGRCHDIGNGSQVGLQLQIFELHRQPAPPIRVLVDGGRNVDLIANTQRVLDGDDQETRRRLREEAGNRGEVDVLCAANGQGMRNASRAALRSSSVSPGSMFSPRLTARACPRIHPASVARSWVLN
jgi:hypothetical protein